MDVDNEIDEKPVEQTVALPAKQADSKIDKNTSIIKIHPQREAEVAKTNLPRIISNELQALIRERNKLEESRQGSSSNQTNDSREQDATRHALQNLDSQIALLRRIAVKGEIDDQLNPLKN